MNGIRTSWLGGFTAPTRWHLEQILREAFANAHVDSTGHWAPGPERKRP